MRSIWLRNELNKFKQRLKVLEAKSAQDGILLTESQLAALEKNKEKLEAISEVATEHPGYLVAQDTYYVGTIKDVGKIYQQTVIDTYSRELLQPSFILIKHPSPALMCLMIELYHSLLSIR